MSNSGSPLFSVASEKRTLDAIPYVAAGAGFALETYQDYNKYGGNTNEFWTATAFNAGGTIGGLAAATAIGAFVPGPGWAVAGASVLAGAVISVTAEYLKRKTLGH